jgi:hypothetical protein
MFQALFVTQASNIEPEKLTVPSYIQEILFRFSAASVFGGIS